MEFKRISLSPLNHREYRLYIFVRFFYIMALRMVATVVAYQLFHLTKSSFSIGIVGLSEFIPVFLLALYSGYIIDKSDKRNMLVRGVFSYSFCVLLLILVTSPWAEANLSAVSRQLSFYIIIFLSAISSILSEIEFPLSESKNPYLTIFFTNFGFWT